MDDKGIFGVGALSLPGVFIIGAALGKSVVAGGQNDIIWVDNAGADL